jgi:hypothetical protein
MAEDTCEIDELRAELARARRNWTYLILVLRRTVEREGDELSVGGISQLRSCAWAPISDEIVDAVIADEIEKLDGKRHEL